MKKSVIALLLSVVMVAGSVGSVPAFAAEAPVQEEVSIESTEEVGEEAVLASEEEADSDMTEDVAVVAETEQTAEEDTDEPEEAASEAETEQAVEEDTDEPDEAASEAGTELAEEEESEQIAEESSDEDENSGEKVGTATAEADADNETGETAAIAETGEAAAIADTEETVITEEELLIETRKEAKLAEDVVDSGSCGENATWTLTGTDNDLTLTISGSGAMDDYFESPIPWESQKTKIKTIIVEEGITYIGDSAFQGCSSLTTATIPDSLTEIGQMVFYSCSSLTSISLPDNLERIGSGAFSGCSSLTGITIPNSVTAIDGGVFSRCSSLTSINIPDSVTIIESYVFSDCSGLTSITIPENVTSIESGAFKGCTGLTSITIPDKVTRIMDYAFSGCSGLTSITIPESVTRLWDYAFEDCSGLTSITIPDGIKYIGKDVFSNCHVNRVNFRGTKEQWEAKWEGSIKYDSIFCNCFSVDADFQLSGTSFVYTGNAIEPAVTVSYNGYTFVEGTDFELEYRNNINVGTASVDIKGIGNYSGVVKKTFSISAKPITNLTISGITNKPYTGKAQTHAIVVKDGSTTLKDGTHYTVSYKNNTNAGTASAVITGKGNYTGSVIRTFTINKAANAVTASNFVKIYSTAAQTFALGATAKGGTLTYASSSKSVTVTKAGKVTIKAKFIGKATITIAAQNANYNKASKKITITVNPKKTGITSAASPAPGKMLVKWKRNAVGTGYQIQYSTSSKFAGAKNVWVTKNKVVNKKITKLTKAKKYYVRMRTYKTVKGVKYYSGWSAVKKVTIKK